jgi:hypothetical protein
MKNRFSFILAAAVMAIASSSAQAVTILRYKTNVGVGFGLGADNSQTMGTAESLITSFAQQQTTGVNGTLGTNISIAKYLLETDADTPIDNTTPNFPFTYKVDVWVNGNASDNYVFTIKGKRTITQISGSPASIADTLTIDAGFSNLVGISAITGTNIFLNFQSFDKLDAPGPSGIGSAFNYDTAQGGSSLTYHINAKPSTVPEPGTLALLMGVGVTGLVVVRRRK